MSQKAFLQEGINTILVDITDIPMGYYFIRIYGTDNVHVQPFVKVIP